jgi:hypothetical protein
MDDSLDWSKSERGVGWSEVERARGRRQKRDLKRIEEKKGKNGKRKGK